jgi:hypothetical protein
LFSSVVASAIGRDEHTADVAASRRRWADVEDEEKEKTHGNESITLASNAAAAATASRASRHSEEATSDMGLMQDTNQQDGTAAAEKSGWYGWRWDTQVWGDDRFKNWAAADDAADEVYPWYVPHSPLKMRALGEALRQAEKTDFRGNMPMSASRMSFAARQTAQNFSHCPTMTQAESDAVGRLITMFFYSMQPIMLTMGPNLPRRAQNQQEPGAWLRLGSSK